MLTGPHGLTASSVQTPALSESAAANQYAGIAELQSSISTGDPTAAISSSSQYSFYQQPPATYQHFTGLLHFDSTIFVVSFDDICELDNNI